jgi:DNA-binding NarL/FixJ family response regulator
MDFSMPLMNGLDAATQLKKDSPRVPIVMLTMFKDKFLEDRAYKAGVSLVLSKEESMVRVADYARILLKPDAPKVPIIKQ